MTTRLDGFRKRTRRKFKKRQSQKGKLSIKDYLTKFNVGETVYLSVEPAYQKGMYRPKFMGKSGKIVGMKGKCYEVQINDMDKSKVLIVHPVHLVRVKNA